MTDSGVAERLRRAGLDVLAPGRLGPYTSDASLYRVAPLAVLRPRDADEVAEGIALCATEGSSITARGGGTSVAGNAIGPGVVIDFSRHLGRVLSVEAAPGSTGSTAGIAVVQAGATQEDVMRAAAPLGLRFGPDPSTSSRCTIGGMIGNNACGARSLAYGRTSDNVLALDAVRADGRAFHTGFDDAGRPNASGADDILGDVGAVMAGHLATARTEFARFDRQLSGYAVEHLLPERGVDLTRALVGSEGTLAIVTSATLRLVSDPGSRVLVALGFADIAEAADAVPGILLSAPTACEGIDSRIVDVTRERRGPDTVPDLPRGAAWLFVEISGDDPAEVATRAALLAATATALDSRVVHGAEAAALWRIREDGAGLAGRAPSSRPAWAGWEDAAVPPAMLGDYLRGFDALVTEYGMSAMPYGHFGEGCIHVRLDFPFERQDGSEVFESFLADAARLVTRYGGSLSGEHGDGRARSALLPAMYTPDAIRMFSEIKAVFDPHGVLNPGVIVDPAPASHDLRVDGGRARPLLQFAYSSDDGDFAQALHRCTGVGRCRADNSAAGQVMCPSFLATREEKDSTRGRARVLQEAIRGDRPDWRSPEVHDALDLCLSCKACSSDCPTGVDMATYKSEVLSHAFAGRLRPRSHYSLGRLPLWSRFASLAPRLVNAVMAVPFVRRPALFVLGIDRRRSVPRFAERTLHRLARGRRADAGERRPVIVFADSFTSHFSPEAGIAMLDVLESAGFAPQLSARSGCCGLTWITTGQLSTARRILSKTVAGLAPAARAGVPIVGLEPSCTAVLRHDAVELLGTDDARAVAAATVTLAELLSADPAWSPPDLSGVQVVAQPHCHHHAVMGWGTDADLLDAAGAVVTKVSGCCGLAGNFGVEIGHYDVSVAVAEHGLLPAVDGAADGAVILADGFSCRVQLEDLRGVRGRHLAELLRDGASAVREKGSEPDAITR